MVILYSSGSSTSPDSKQTAVAPHFNIMDSHYNAELTHFTKCHLPTSKITPFAILIHDLEEWFAQMHLPDWQFYLSWAIRQWDMLSPVMTTRSWDRLIFIMGILMLEGWRLHTEGLPGINCQTSNISHTIVGNIILDNSDVVGASPVGAAPTTSSGCEIKGSGGAKCSQIEPKCS